MPIDIPSDHPPVSQPADEADDVPETDLVIDLNSSQDPEDAHPADAHSAEEAALDSGWRAASATPEESATGRATSHEREDADMPAAAPEESSDIVGSAAQLVVVGVGGAGCNIVNHMIESGMSGVTFFAINTDTQALSRSKARHRIAIGADLTRGMGTGGNPAIGQQAAQESYHELVHALDTADMVFIAAGMGGGTGTGASPIIAQAAREAGALTLAIVTTPFAFERRRRTLAEQGVAALRTVVDALITVPNERLAQLVGRETSLFEAYRKADEVIRIGVQGVSDLITIPGLVNLDFADVRAVMSQAGSAYLATGSASGEGRADKALRSALSNPLMDVDITGARGLLFNVTGGDDLSMAEVEQIANELSATAHPQANLIFGATYDPNAGDALKVTVVATGFEPHVAPEARPSTWTPGRVFLAPGAQEAQPGQRGPAAPSIAPEPPIPGRMIFDDKPLPELSPPDNESTWTSATPPWTRQQTQTPGPGQPPDVTVNRGAPPQGRTTGQPQSQAPGQPPSRSSGGAPPPAPGRPPSGRADQTARPTYPREDYAENTEDSDPPEQDDRHGFWSRLFSSPSNAPQPTNEPQPPDARHP